MNFKIKVKMNSANKIIKDHGLDRDGNVNAFLRDEVERLSDPYVPFHSGSLKNNTIHPSNHEIKYVEPYAHYMYKGKMYISPKLGVSGVLTKNNTWWSPYGETKTKTNKPLKYQGAPKRGAEWDKRMMRDKGKQVAKDVERYIKKGGK